VGPQKNTDIGNRFGVIHVAAPLGQAVALSKVAEDLEKPGWVPAMLQPDVHVRPGPGAFLTVNLAAQAFELDFVAGGGDEHFEMLHVSVTRVLNS
jgi:hypothetical protein